MDTTRIRIRDAAQRRLRRLTFAVIGGAGVAGLALSGLAAKAFPGRSSSSTKTVVTTRTHAAAPKKPAQSAPPLVSSGEGAPAQSSPPPAQSSPAPVQSSAPPVAVSGGS